MSFMHSATINAKRVDVRRAVRRLRRLSGTLICRLVGAAIGHFTRSDSGRPVVTGAGADNAAAINHILIARFDGIGDIVLTTPLLRAIKAALPHCKITFVTHAGYIDLLRTCPYIDHLVGASLSQHRNFTGIGNVWPAFTLARELKDDRRFDVAITPRVQGDDAFAAFLILFSGAGRRIGFREQTNASSDLAGLFRLDNLMTDTVQPVPGHHEVEQTFSLLRSIGLPMADPHVALWPDAADRDYAECFFADHGINRDTLVIAVAPGCSDPRRTWPEERFLDVCHQLVGTGNISILVVGGPEDRALARRFKASLNEAAAIAVGKASLRQSAALMEKCNLFIGNDSGPMHIAAAMAVPIVEVSCHPLDGAPHHSNSPDRFGPWQVPQRILRPRPGAPECQDYCAGSSAHCILGVTTAEVVSAALSLIPQDRLRQQNL